MYSIISSISSYALLGVSVAAILYQLASTQFVFVDPYQHQSIHLALISTIMFLFSSRRRPRFWPVWWGLILLTILSVGYMFVNTEELQFRLGLPTTTDMIVGGMLVAVTLVALYEAFGKILPIFVAIFIIYTFFGHYLPSPFYHPELELDRIMTLLAVGFSGLYGPLLQISASYLFLFLVFAGLLPITGATKFFTEIGKLAGRKLAGGPGMTSIVASALFGSVTGAPMANVVVTGTFTIPMMKKAGFTPEVAGGIEAAASTGGLVMPPIMAATAFIMATFIGIPYRVVMILAFPAALLYYFSCGFYVVLQAKKLKLATSEIEVDKKALLQSSVSFLVPLGTIVLLLLIGYSPQYSVFWGIIVTLIVFSFAKLRSRGSVHDLKDALIDGATNGARVGVTVAALGIAMSTMTMTGLGVKLPLAVEMASGGNVVFAVLASMVVTIILGCGLPILPAYILVALIVAPALVGMGIPALQVHFFIFYFAAFSMVTPPVAVSAIVAAQIAKASYFKTSLEALKVAIAAFMLPFLFIWAPSILLQFSGLYDAIISFAGIIMAIIALLSALVGFYLTPLNWAERILFGAAGAGLFIASCTQGLVFFIIGALLFALMTVWQGYKRKKIIKDEVDVYLYR